MRIKSHYIAVVFFIFGIAVSTASALVNERSLPSAPRLPYRVVATYPHNNKAFTQGLFFDNGHLYESTGLRGHSSLRKVELATGNVLTLRDLPGDVFGEGLALHENTIIQITYTSHVAFVYNKDSFELLKIFSYPTQGWGLTCDGTSFIMSDGSETLIFRDAKTFRETWRLTVHDDHGAIKKLNELEYINDHIFANILSQPVIARIHPTTGLITGLLDLSELIMAHPEETAGGVLNGIAYDPASGHLFITGKKWSALFELELLPEKN